MIDIKKQKKLINLILIIVAFLMLLFVCFGQFEEYEIKANGLVKKFYTETETSTEENITEEDIDEVIDEDGTKPQKDFEMIAALADGDVTFEIHAVNKYTAWKTDAPILVYGDGKTVKTATGSSMSFMYWDAVIVSYIDENYVVTEMVVDDVSKSNITIPTGGFVILFYYEQSAIPSTLTVGTYIVPNFDYEAVNGEHNLTGLTITSTNEKPSNSFEKAERNNKLDLIDNPTSTSDFMRINLYDYTYVDKNNHINSKYDSYPTIYPGFQCSGGVSSFSNNKWGYGFDSNIVTDLKAARSGVTTKPTDLPITINTLYDGDYPLGYAYSVLKSTLGTDGYPALSDGTSLGYLFGAGNESYVKKINSTHLDGLFQYDENSQKYWFNSRKNHAEYNEETNKFDLYKQVITSNFMTYPFGSFLPFSNIKLAKQSSSIDNSYWQEMIDSADYKASVETDSAFATAYSNISKALSQFLGLGNRTGLNSVNAYFEKADGVQNAFNNRMDELDNLYNIDFDDYKNYFFGLTVSLKFIQSENGWCETDNTPREFYFVGDDDVWIYIDNVLFLDLSGIHRHVGGKIDFNAGKVYYYKSKSLLHGDVDIENPIKTVDFSDLVKTPDKLNSKGTFKDNTAHTINLFYLERGSGSSVCNIEFNIERNHVEGTAIWKADTVADRPEKITIDLYQDGKYYATTTTDASKKWEYEFTEIPFFDINGNTHVYTVKLHDELDDYDTEYVIDGEESSVIDIVNTYKYRNITVKKVWDDNDFENRPTEVIAELSATVNGNNYDIPAEVEKVVTLNSDNNWQYVWENLDRSYDETAILYDIKEKEVPDGYVSNVEKNVNTFTITNTKYRSITINKYEKNDYDKKLGGAEFKLEKLIEEDGKYVVDQNFEIRTGITSSENGNLGELKFENLTYGKYRLTETKAPKGYQLLRKPVEVDVTSESLNFNVDIENRKNIILPETGGSTKLFILIVSVLVIFVMYKQIMKTQIFLNRSNLRILKNSSVNSQNEKKEKRKPRISK